MGNSMYETLTQRKAKVVEGGGAARIEKQHQAGKMTARERLNALLDERSFVEIDALVEHRCSDFGMEGMHVPGEGVVTGYGSINGRLVYVYAQDFTVVGGSLGEMHAKKITKVMDLALKTGAPIIGINDSGGARIQEGVDALAGYGSIFYRNTISSGVIPQISVIMGPCAGGAVYSPAITDFVFMTDKTSNTFITGPAVIKAVTGEEVTSEALGGAMTHNSISGVAHFINPTESETLEAIKKLLSFLPANNMEQPPVKPCCDDINRVCDALDSFLPENPNKAYDMKRIITSVVDDGDFFEVQPYYAKNIIVGFGRIGGGPIGIIANQPSVMAGCLDINASDKAARFISFCDCFNIPIVTFADVPGFLPGVNQEHGGIIRHGAKLLYAYSEATVPKITIVVRKAYGGAYLAMCSKELGADQMIAWASAEIAVMGPEGAAGIIFRKEIEGAEDSAAAYKDKVAEYKEKFSNPYRAAARGLIDDVIFPSETRARIASALEMLKNKRDVLPAKKHGNFPV